MPHASRVLGAEKKTISCRRRYDALTSYSGAIETADVFGRRIYQEAMRRGMHWAGEVIVIGDGAIWIWNIADEQFYEATKIVDLYHAREHYWNVAKSCFGQRNVVKNWLK